MSDKIIIIGNGFSGLGTAITFAKYGYTVKIIAPKNNSQLLGGLQIAPNTFKALSSLGLENEIVSQANRLLAVDIKTFDIGSNLSNISLLKNKTPYLSMAREDLYQILLKKCLRNSLIEFVYAKVIAISHQLNITRLILDNDEIITAPFIIGADGWNGKTRHFVNPNASQIHSNYSIYRSVFSSSKVPTGFSYPNVQLWLGQSCHLVSYPIRKDNEVNFVFAFSKKTFPKSSIKSIFSNHPVLSALGEKQEKWHLTNIKNCEPLFNWRRGSVTLIGDAAHPMPPHLAQGAGQSFMDVECIETELGKGNSVSDALKNMIKLRMSEAYSITRKSQISGSIFRMNGPLAILRNQIIGIAGKKIINEFLHDLWISD